MAKPKRKKRTSIRTAAGTVQDLFLARMQALVGDPTVVLPEPSEDEHKVLAKVRNRVEKIATGKVGFLDKRDKGVVGGVANALPLAEMPAVPRIADGKVAGKRRFYLQRGHVERSVSLGVQNYDDPIALLMAYRSMAKENGLHFFAGPKLWCTGQTPQPPQAWLDEFTDIDWQNEADGLLGCGHGEVARVLLQFRDGPGLAVCGSCGKKSGSVHAQLGIRYAGPKQRQPVDVYRLENGVRTDFGSENVAAYRGGIMSESVLLKRG